MSENPTNVEPVERLSETWWAMRSPEIRARRCSAHRRNGAQCAKVAMEAQKVCGTHGGRAPQAKAKARRRIDEAADRMARELLGIATGAESEAVKLAAVKHALAIGGLSEKHALSVEVEAVAVDDILDAATFDVAQLTKAQHDALAGRAPVAALPPASAGIVDVEVVVEAPPRTPSATAGHAAAADRNDGPPARPAWAEDPPEPPRRGLMTLEEANAALREDEARVRAARATPTGADAPRPTRVVRARRRRG